MRQRDELFEALAVSCGWDWRDMTKTARGRLNQALMELREVEATPQEVLACARIYRAIYEGAALTPQALVGNWPELKRHLRQSSYRYDPEESMQHALMKAGETEALTQAVLTDTPVEMTDEQKADVKKRIHELTESLAKEPDGGEEEQDQAHHATQQG